MEVPAVLIENPIAAAVALFVAILIPMLLVQWLTEKAMPDFLEPTEFKEMPLVAKTILTHNTRRFRFALDHPKQRLGLPIGQHITFKTKMPDGTDCFRPYTPVSDDDQIGFVDFVIKVYPEGKMSKHVDTMNIGDKLLFKGPKGRFKYQPNTERALGLIAGGSGITPMYQVANAILRNPDDKTDITLIFANVSEEDILLKEELDAWDRMYPQFKVYYVLNNPPEGWQGGVGFVSEAMIRELLPPPASDIMVLRCGPSPMNRAVESHLNNIGYAPTMQFEF